MRRKTASTKQHGTMRNRDLRKRTISNRSAAIGRQPSRNEHRRGTALVVVMGLLGLLMFLGFAFFTFARQEEGNAEYFNAAARRVDDPGLSPDLLFDFSLRQVIMGARDDEPNSALWGGRHSMMANMFGRDIHPYSGQGVNISPVNLYGETINEGFQVDRDYNGNVIQNGLLQMNDSPAARNGTGANFVGSGYPEPDVDYTYPDMNNRFIAYNGYGTNLNNQPIRVIIPSYHRPQYMRYVDTSDGVSRPVREWWTDAPTSEPGRSLNTARMVLGPHTSRRYIAGKTPTAYTDLGPRYAAAFDFTTELDDTTNGAIGRPGEQGVWSIAPWRPSTAYVVNEIVVPRDPATRTLRSNASLAYRCQTAGTAHGSSEPTWPTAIGNTVTDNGVVWEAIDLTRTPAHVEYHVDADGDGIKEAILLDLDYPVQTMNDGTGRKFIPLFGITIYDADGLLNLVAQGNVDFNLANFRADANMDTNVDPFGGDLNNDGTLDTMLSRSNLGLSPHEINPSFGLNADPVADLTDPEHLQQLEYFFGRRPTSSLEAANMEWFLSRVGRLQYQRAGVYTDAFTGLYGERSVTINRAKGSGSVWPQPGRIGRDDNNNRNVGLNLANFGGNLFRPYGHPLDFTGRGRNYYNAFETPPTGNIRGKTLRRTGAYSGGNFNSFLSYVDYSNGNSNPLTAFANGVTWESYLPFGTTGIRLMTSSERDALIDEAFELYVNHDSPSLDDDLFAIGDSGFLQMSTSDVNTIGQTARVRSLMEYNLWTSGRAEEIRKRFTTVGADIKQYGKSWFKDGASSVGPMRRWEFSLLNLPLGGPSPSQRPFVEPREFPPRFGAIPAVGFNQTAPANDPFRPALRNRLRILANDQSTTDLNFRRLQQRMLNINGVVQDNAFAQTRSLTEHPTNDPGTAVITPLNAAQIAAGPPNAFGSAALQEAWARYDRQILARDIYVMLYTFCGGRDDINYANTDNARVGDLVPAPAGYPSTAQISERPLYNDDQLREMAQFAINYVNQLDRDHVLDAFEYDRNLYNGWNLDDDPYSNNTTLETAGNLVVDNTADSDDRGVVYGVEQQQLTLSEALCVKTDTVEDMMGTAVDLKATQWDDDEDRFYAFVELRNAAPFSTNMRAGATGGQWQIEMEVTPHASYVGPLPVPKRYLTFLNNPPAGAIAPGDIFRVSSAGDEYVNPDDPGVILPSYMRADLTYDEGMDPNADFTGLPLAPRSTDTSTEIDVLKNPARIDLRDDAGGTAMKGLLDSINAGGDDTLPREITFRLRRRVHATRSVPGGLDPLSTTDAYNADNPWVQVDEFRITPDNGIAFLDLEDDDKKGENIKHRLTRHPTTNRPMASREREEPLDRFTVQTYVEADLATTPYNNRMPLMSSVDMGNADNSEYVPVAESRFIFNSLGTTNHSTLRTNRSFRLWQLQYDRDLASASELLTVPTYGPDDVTSKVDKSGRFTAGTRKILSPMQPLANFDDTPIPPPADTLPGNPNVDDNTNGVIDDGDERGSGNDATNIDDPAYVWLSGRGAAVGIQIPNTTKYDNRWYRLFNFVEFPAVTAASFSEFAVTEPGVMNVNGIRYPDSLAGLIDDPFAFPTFNPIRDGQLGNNILPDSSGETLRDWWFQFLYARDQVDGVTHMVLPGSPNSRPFRSLNFAAEGSNSLERTVLRKLPTAVHTHVTGDNTADNVPAGFEGQPRRHLFELQSQAEFENTNENSKPDYVGRNRLLSKVLNNTTTRSNTFFVFMQVEFYEVTESTVAGQTLQQIGAKMPESPSHRGFFVVDRSVAFDLIQQQHFVSTNVGAAESIANKASIYTLNDSFPYQRLVRHRQIIE